MPLQQCDCCGQMRWSCTTSFVSYVGDTTACGPCRSAPEEEQWAREEALEEEPPSHPKLHRPWRDNS